MPKAGKNLSFSNSRSSEESVQKALEAIRNGLGQRKAAKTYGVPRTTLQFRLSADFHGKISRGPAPVLSLEEEDLLEKFIISSCARGFPKRDEDIRASVKEFLDAVPRDNPFKDNYPGNGWYRAFLKRHPKISLRTAESVTAASSVVSENDIKKWFKQIYEYLETKGLVDILDDPSRIYNGDETCFYLCPKNNKVLAPKGSCNVYEIEHHPKLNLTVMFTFAANGDISPPMIIYPYKRLPQDIVKSVSPGWGVGCSETGWMTKETFYEYIGNVLYPDLKKKGVKFPIILFVDGHKTHMTYNISQLCSELGIILVSLYPNSTRILQPADVSSFKPLKNGWKKAVLEFRRQNPYEVVTKEKFAPILKMTVDNYLRTEVVQNGFKACGLFPWNPSAIDYDKCLSKRGSETQTLSCERNNLRCLRYEDFQTICGEEILSELQNTVENVTENIYYNKLQDIQKFFHEGGNVRSIPEETNVDIGTEINNTEDDNYSEVCTGVEKNAGSFDIENMPIVISDSNNVIIEYIQPPNNSKPDHKQSLGDFIIWPDTPKRKNKRNTEKVPYVLTSSGWKKIFTEKAESKKKSEELKNEKRIARERNKTQKLLEKENLKKQKKSRFADKVLLNKINLKRKRTSNKLETTKNAVQSVLPYLEGVNSGCTEDPNYNSHNEMVWNGIKRKEEQAIKYKEEQDLNDPKEKSGNEEKNMSDEIELDMSFMQESSGEGLVSDYTEISSMEKNKRENSQTNLRYKVDSVKKKIQFDECDNVMGDIKKVKVLSNITIKSACATKIEESYEYKFKNPRIYKGICFTCTQNISFSRFGMKCTTCRRTYHLKCILTNDCLPFEIFQCKGCLNHNK